MMAMVMTMILFNQFQGHLSSEEFTRLLSEMMAKMTKMTKNLTKKLTKVILLTHFTVGSKATSPPKNVLASYPIAQKALFLSDFLAEKPTVLCSNMSLKKAAKISVCLCSATCRI